MSFCKGHACQELHQLLPGPNYLPCHAGNSLWVAVLWCCVNSPFLPRGRSWSVRILQLAFGFFCVVVVNTYTASLASLLTVQNLSTPITSLLDLLRA